MYLLQLKPQNESIDSTYPTMYKRKVNNKWSFREANTKEFTHCYHTYPAMMIPQVARELISEFKPHGKLNLLFDPYMGSGTSLVEASILGINSIGTDLNPLARLMSKVKTTHYDEKTLSYLLTVLQAEIFCYKEENVRQQNFDKISNYSYWYSKDNLLKLSYLSQIIEEHVDSEFVDFFKIALSEVVREVSFTRNSEFKRFRMPIDKIKLFNPNTFKLFEEKASRNLKGLKEYNSIPHRPCTIIADFNSTIDIPSDILPDNSVDIVVTSPPYGDSRTTVAYGQFSRWANEWFNFENAQNLDSILMGGKKCNQATFQSNSIAEVLNCIKALDEKRYFEVISFLNDYHESIKNVAKTIRNGGTACYVVGNRNVKGTQISLDFFTAEMFEKYGFKHKITLVREIPNKRMPSKTSPTNKTGKKVSTMNNEYIVILDKI